MNGATALLCCIGLLVARGVAAEDAEEAPEQAAKQEKTALEPPAGFKVVKRGKHVVYCKRDSNMGTRLMKTTCYDEQQLRDYLLVQQENNREVDRARKICSSQGQCGAN